MIDTLVLKETINSNPTSKAVFDVFAERQRYRRVTNLESFKEQLIAHGVPIDTKQFYETFYELEKAGAGHLETQGDGDTIFSWKVPFTRLVKLLYGQTNVIPPIPKLRKHKLRMGIQRVISVKQEGSVTKIEILIPNKLIKLIEQNQ